MGNRAEAEVKEFNVVFPVAVVVLVFEAAVVEVAEEGGRLNMFVCSFVRSLLTVSVINLISFQKRVKYVFQAIQSLQNKNDIKNESLEAFNSKYKRKKGM